MTSENKYICSYCKKPASEEIVNKLKLTFCSQKCYVKSERAFRVRQRIFLAVCGILVTLASGNILLGLVIVFLLACIID